MIVKHIAIIGATGATGKEVIKHAFKQRYLVTAVARNSVFVKAEENLTTVSGDVRNVDSLIKAFYKVDAVISCFGSANNFKAGDLMSAGTKNIIAACEKSGVTRLVFMSGILQSDGKELFPLNRLGLKFIRPFYRKIYKDKKIAEDAITGSNLQWTVIRAVALNDSAATSTFSAGVKLGVSPFTPLSHADCAACLVKAVTEESWMKTIINAGK